MDDTGSVRVVLPDFVDDYLTICSKVIVILGGLRLAAILGINHLTIFVLIESCLRRIKMMFL